MKFVVAIDPTWDCKISPDILGSRLAELMLRLYWNYSSGEHNEAPMYTLMTLGDNEMDDFLPLPNLPTSFKWAEASSTVSLDDNLIKMRLCDVLDRVRWDFDPICPATSVLIVLGAPKALGPSHQEFLAQYKTRAQRHGVKLWFITDSEIGPKSHIAPIVSKLSLSNLLRVSYLSLPVVLGKQCISKSNEVGGFTAGETLDDTDLVSLQADTLSGSTKEFPFVFTEGEQNKGIPGNTTHSGEISGVTVPISSSVSFQAFHTDPLPLPCSAGSVGFTSHNELLPLCFDPKYIPTNLPSFNDYATPVTESPSIDFSMAEQCDESTPAKPTVSSRPHMGIDILPLEELERRLKSPLDAMSSGSDGIVEQVVIRFELALRDYHQQLDTGSLAPFLPDISKLIGLLSLNIGHDSAKHVLVNSLKRFTRVFNKQITKLYKKHDFASATPVAAPKIRARKSKKDSPIKKAKRKRSKMRVQSMLAKQDTKMENLGYFSRSLASENPWQSLVKKKKLSPGLPISPEKENIKSTVQVFESPARKKSNRAEMVLESPGFSPSALALAHKRIPRSTIPKNLFK